MIRMVLPCPRCYRPHVDRGEWAHRPHRKHLCEHCGCIFQPRVWCTRGITPPMLGEEARFLCLIVGLALIVIALLPGCVHRPTPADPARCSIGSSASHSRGTAFGEPSEDVTVTVWSQCDI